MDLWHAAFIGLHEVNKLFWLTCFCSVFLSLWILWKNAQDVTGFQAIISSRFFIGGFQHGRGPFLGSF